MSEPTTQELRKFINMAWYPHGSVVAKTMTDHEVLPGVGASVEVEDAMTNQAGEAMSQMLASDELSMILKLAEIYTHSIRAAAETPGVHARLDSEHLVMFACAVIVLIGEKQAYALAAKLGITDQVEELDFMKGADEDGIDG